MIEIYAVTAGLLFALSLYGVLSRADLVQRLLAANIMASSVFMYLVVLAAGREDGAGDPVPQAMVLTGIVIAVSITAFGLGLVRWLREEDEAAGSRTDDNGGDEATTADG